MDLKSCKRTLFGLHYPQLQEREEGESRIEEESWDRGDLNGCTVYFRGMWSVRNMSHTPSKLLEQENRRYEGLDSLGIKPHQ